MVLEGELVKFSIIIPVYNSEKYIERCVNSIINQGYPDIEIILVDDGSTDKSGVLVDTFAKKYEFVKVVHKENGGVSSARNLGLTISTGDYILFMDNDDYLVGENAFFEINAQLMESHAELLMFDVTRSPEEGGRPSILHREAVFGQPLFQALENLIRADKLARAVWAKCIKREVILENNLTFPEGMRNEDIDFTARLIRAIHKIDWYPKVLYVWTIREGQQSSVKQSESEINDLFEIMIDNLNQSDYFRDMHEREAYLAHLSWPFVVLLGYLKDYSLSHKNGKERIAAQSKLEILRKYKDILLYNWYPKTKPVSRIYRFMGFRFTVFCLGKKMQWSRSKGAK